MKLQRILILFLIITVVLSPVMVHGNGVEVIPAYITGKIDLKGYNFSDVVSSAYVYANATGNFTSQVQVKNDGTYTLTVNTPADGSPREYTLYARVSLKSSSIIQFDAGEHVKLQTVREQSYSVNFSHKMATLTVEGNFSNDDWTQISPYYNSGSTNYLYAYLYFNKTGANSFLIPANIPFKWVLGYAYPKDTTKYTSLSLEKKEFTAKPGETVKLSWSGTFPDIPPTGKIYGTVSYGPLLEGSLTRHNLYAGSKSTTIVKDGSYEINNIPAGNNISLRAYSYFNNSRQYLYWPYSYINPENTNGYINLPAASVKEVNLSAKPAMVKGKISITGSKSTSDVTSGLHIRAIGVSGTNTYGGSALDQGIINTTGEYSLYLTPGLWDVGCSFNSNYFTFSNNSSNPEEYLNSSLCITTTQGQ